MMNTIDLLESLNGHSIVHVDPEVGLFVAYNGSETFRLFWMDSFEEFECFTIQNPVSTEVAMCIAAKHVQNMA